MSDLPRWVFGFDPSITETGIARPMTVGVAGGPAAQGDERLRVIYTAVTKAVNPYAAMGVGNGCLAIIEDLPTHAHGAGKTGMAQGVVRLALTHALVPYVLIPPATLKKFATGKGNATKSDMRVAWFKRTGEDVRNDNECDALWLRELGLHAITHRLARKLPKAQHDVILRLAWPEAIAANLLAPYEVAVTG